MFLVSRSCLLLKNDAKNKQSDQDKYDQQNLFALL